jgi:hypothetical protein
LSERKNVPKVAFANIIELFNSNLRDGA